MDGLDTTPGRCLADDLEVVAAAQIWGVVDGQHPNLRRVESICLASLRSMSVRCGGDVAPAEEWTSAEC